MLTFHLGLCRILLVLQEKKSNVLCFYQICESEYQLFSHVQLFATPCSIARKAVLSMKFSRQEYWSRQPFHSPRDLPDPGIEPRSFVLQSDPLHLSHQGIYTAVNRFKPPYMLIVLQCQWNSLKTHRLSVLEIRDTQNHHGIPVFKGIQMPVSRPT